MNCDVTLTAEEFSNLHNNLWVLDRAVEDLAPVLNKDMHERLLRAAQEIRQSLSGAYEQDSTAFDRKSSHYDRIRDELGLGSVWSLYEVNDLSTPHPFQGARTITYRDHWGEGGERVVAINGLTWAALYVAADAAIRDSGDEHHIYIEAFRVDGDTLILSTGS